MKTIKRAKKTKKMTPPKMAAKKAEAPEWLPFKTAKIGDAKNNLSRYLAYVRKGGCVRSLDRNTPIAELRPIPPRPEGDDEDALIAWLEDRGMLIPPKDRSPMPASFYTRKLPRMKKGHSIIQTVIDGRRE